jgi:hypothetical protein
MALPYICMLLWKKKNASFVPDCFQTFLIASFLPKQKPNHNFYVFPLQCQSKFPFLPLFPWGDLMPFFGRMDEWHGTGLI